MKQDAAQTTIDLTDPFVARKAKLEAAREKGLNPYNYTHPRTAMAADLQAKYAALENGVETTDEVGVAGRIMAMRNSGMFIDLQDVSGKIQVFCHKDSLSAEELAKLETLDLGDLVGAVGTIRRTPRGELSVRVKTIDLLTKTLQPLPEKHHGLQDIETRYRQRYVDLIVNDESRDRLRKRSQIVMAVREYITKEWNGLEVETPILHPIMGGASAKPFTTHHNALDTQFYLRVAPELYLKRLIVGGLADCVFEIGRNFRNEGLSIKHNPEYTACELYKAYADYTDMMALTEGLFRYAAQTVLGTQQVTYADREIDLEKPWARKSMTALVADITGVDFLQVNGDEAARAKAKELGVHVENNAKWGEVVQALFDAKVEETLVQPTHVTDIPVDVSPLAKRHRTDPRLTERFESFINGWEVVNAFTELNDPADQLARFEEQAAAKDAGNEEAMMVDHDYVTALEFGLPPTGGWGLGIDRMCMLLTNASNIKDVILFPTLKPLKG